ncbi:hypothetical protein ACJJTC_000166 [Scirpophaga incertulas]
MDTTKTDICRICCNENDILYSLLNDAFTHYERLNDKLGDTNLKIDLSFGSSYICSQCLKELETCVNFLDKCEKANEVLASRSVDILKDSDDESEQLDKDIHVGAEICKEIEAPAESVAKCPECGSRRRCGHWAPPSAFVCPHCQKIFTRKFNFTLHLKRHIGQRDWPCPACGVRQLTRWQARNHCGPKKRLHCPIEGCSKSFTGTTNLNSHIHTHLGKRPYRCEECGKTFTAKNTLNNHERIHTGVKPFLCRLCGRQFATNKLAAHMRAHRGEGHAFACEAECRRTFASRRSLRQHRCSREPSDVKPHACALCPAKYVHRQSLKKHLRMMHAEFDKHSFRKVCRAYRAQGLGRAISPATKNKALRAIWVIELS